MIVILLGLVVVADDETCVVDCVELMPIEVVLFAQLANIANADKRDTPIVIAVVVFNRNIMANPPFAETDTASCDYYSMAHKKLYISTKICYKYVSY